MIIATILHFPNTYKQRMAFSCTASHDARVDTVELDGRGVSCRQCKQSALFDNASLAVEGVHLGSLYSPQELRCPLEPGQHMWGRREESMVWGKGVDFTQTYSSLN